MLKNGQNLSFVIHILKVAHRHQNTPTVQFSAIYDNFWGFYADFCVSDFFKFSQLFWAPAELLLIPTVTQLAVVWKILNLGLQKFDNLYINGMERLKNNFYCYTFLYNDLIGLKLPGSKWPPARFKSLEKTSL